ncbi:hypothetical protein K9M48_02365 [Candidatus Gracilibacteria bacterium]|nr:hypothetical protein [Candidatus Gracilibacteria bacterium]
MEQLFVVRHGDYAVGGILSEEGKNQIMSHLVPQIRSLIRYDRKPLPTIAIISSTAPRAFETAQIIRDGIDDFKVRGYEEINPFLGIALCPYLWSANDAENKSETYYSQRNCNKILSILENHDSSMDVIYPDRTIKGADTLSNYTVVIIVSHLEVVDEFPLFFIENILRANLDTSPIRNITNNSSFKKGEGVYIDILKKEFKLLKDNDDTLLNSKLNLLHNLLVITDPHPDLPNELSDYRNAFQNFLEETSACTDSFDEVYTNALAKFRDVLLADI